MKILFATPTYGNVATEYVASMMRLQAALLGKGVQSRCAFNSMAEIARSRNSLATHFWEDTELTHLLFIDSDMGFAPDAVGALIRARRPVVGAVYPKRRLDLDRLVSMARQHDDPRTAIASALEWVVQPGSSSAEVTDGLCKVDGLGMGLCLIEREVFAKLLATGKISQDHAHGTSLHRGPALGFFDAFATAQGSIPEDLAFCRRWREWCGGEVWAVLDQDVAHVGSMVFQGRCLDALAAKGPKSGELQGD